MTSPVLVWFRRDLRLSDHAALTAACDLGRPVIPVFLNDEGVAPLGAAPKWRLEQGLRALSASIEALGSRLILRSGPAEQALQSLIAETGATAVFWSRSYDPALRDRDVALKAALHGQGIDAQSFKGHLLFEPWTAQTKAGGFFKVYTPFWKTVRDRAVDAPLPAPTHLITPQSWPLSEALENWNLGRAMNRGAAVLTRNVPAGEVAAQDKLADFVAHKVGRYDDDRDFPGTEGTSNLSDHLSVGEISPRQCWHAAQRALQDGAKGTETFLKEITWREFAWHLLFHTPHLTYDTWREDWRGFQWITDESAPEVLAWQQGRTGIEIVDAGMRELQVTGRMHNRVRMIVASFLTKNLLVDWRIGMRWFEQHLIDWDPASNAMGWQWVAGCGPDAAPYFRVFNPVTQAEKFDPRARYRRRWLVEGARDPHADALAYFDAVPRRWGLSSDQRHTPPMQDVSEGRKRALAAYEQFKALKQ